MPSHKLIQIVAAESSAPEKDAKFAKWYTEKHVPMLFGYEGVKAASRYKLKGDDKNCSKYLTFYEFDTQDALAAFPKSPAFTAAIEDFEANKEDLGFTMRWAGVYELIKSWKR